MNRQMGMAMTVAFLAVVAGTLSAGGVTWSPTATGTYSWADPDNWGGTLPTTNDTVTFGALSGNQTIDAPEGSVAGLRIRRNRIPPGMATDLLHADGLFRNYGGNILLFLSWNSYDYQE